VQGKVPVGLRRLDRIPTRRVAKHAIAGHLDIEDVLLPVAPGVRDDPLDTLAAAAQALQRVAVLGPDQALAVRIPVELETLLVEHVLGDGEADAEPVRGPAGAEGGADVSGLELMGDGLLEGRTLQVRDRVDRELDMLWIGGDGLEVLPVGRS